MPDNKEVYTFSRYVILIGPNNLYINFTTSSKKGPFRYLIGTGHFFRSPGSNEINTYEGVVTELDGTASFKQRAKKIPNSKVSEFKKNYGNDWVMKLLKDNESNEPIKCNKNSK